MAQTRTSKTHKFRRDAWIEINLENLEYNLKKIYEAVATPLMPVIKADAYGHGASIIAPILEAYDFVWGFGVAALDEALGLREIGIKKNILILGITPTWAFEAALKNSLDITIVDAASAFELNEVAKSLGIKASVHLKVDTGLNRIGFREDEFLKIIDKISELKNLEIKYVFSHFADSTDLKYTCEQLEKFELLTKGLPYQKHIASSFAARSIFQSRFDLVRCGIELYGLRPSENILDFEMRPLLSLFGRVSYIKEINPGETVSYSRTWQASKTSKIATLPLGYADGISRLLSNKMIAFCKGARIQQVGSITMDQLMLDVSNIQDVKVGDVIELVGENISLDDWARIIGTINYEVATGLNLRLPKIYTRPEKKFNQ